jgi:hypothetical protein
MSTLPRGRSGAAALGVLNSLAGEGARFFGIEIGAVRIGDSPVAPTFTLRAQPNDWHARLSALAKSGLPASAKGQLYREFWGKFLECVHAERPAWTRAKVPTTENWMVMPSPVKGSVNGFNFPPGQLRAEGAAAEPQGLSHRRLLSWRRDSTGRLR